MPHDENHMREALVLAARGAGRTRPNPAVGCVIVRGGRVVGLGWHRRAGLPHAEVEALRSLRDPAQARGATAYVTLEPCSSHGRTPPCTDALIAAGVARVVVGATDPDPRHRGRGLALLRRAGITVRRGVLAAECAALNPEFHHFMSTGLPWVIAKCGLSLDGRLTRPPGESRLITSAEARKDAMKLRARVEAVLVGAGTVRADDPALTVRGLPGAAQPRRVVWAPRSAPPAGARIFRDAGRDRTLVLTQRSLRAALRSLARGGVQSVLVEGGGHTLGRLFDLGLVNEVVFYLGARLAGGAVPAVGGRGRRGPVRLVAPEVRRIGDDLRISGFWPAGQMRSPSRFS
jgi:diaminohydroxyphosphoribosylaminopyrimidine deaminase/5-amino-6-(5-phosphoribosylamino)uracil reductase